MKVDNWFQQAGKEEAVHEGRKVFMGDPDWSPDWRDRETLMLLIEPSRERCGMNHSRTKTLWKQGRKKLESEY
jgi:hypothetical protein